MSGSFRVVFYCLSGLGMALAACTHVPQTAALTPAPLLSAPSGAQQAKARATGPVMVVVLDERSQKLIGRRMDAYGSQAAIHIPPDVDRILATAAVTALRMQGYDAREAMKTGAAFSTAVFRISLRDLSYDAKNNILLGSEITASAGFRVRISGEGRDFEQFYRGESKSAKIMAMTSEENNRLLTAAIDEALGKIFKDQELQAALLNCGAVCRN